MDIGEGSFANRESSGEEGSHVDILVMPEARGETKKRRRIPRAAKAARGVVCPFTLPLLASLDSLARSLARQSARARAHEERTQRNSSRRTRRVYPEEAGADFVVGCEAMRRIRAKRYEREDPFEI